MRYNMVCYLRLGYSPDHLAFWFPFIKLIFRKNNEKRFVKSFSPK